jgi:sarcosine oxidase delta subunit
MAFLLDCPNCGPRDVSEFSYGGEILTAAGSNRPGPQPERWYHRLGCRRWFGAVRDVRTNALVRTGPLADLLGTGRPEGDAP